MVHTGHTTPSAVNLLFPPAGSFVPVFGRFSEQTSGGKAGGGPFSFSEAYESGTVEEVADDFYGREAGFFEYGSRLLGKFRIEFHH